MLGGFHGVLHVAVQEVSLHPLLRALDHCRARCLPGHIAGVVQLTEELVRGIENPREESKCAAEPAGHHHLALHQPAAVLREDRLLVLEGSHGGTHGPTEGSTHGRIVGREFDHCGLLQRVGHKVLHRRQHHRLDRSGDQVDHHRLDREQVRDHQFPQPAHLVVDAGPEARAVRCSIFGEGIQLATLLHRQAQGFLEVVVVEGTLNGHREAALDFLCGLTRLARCDHLLPEGGGLLVVQPLIRHQAFHGRPLETREALLPLPVQGAPEGAHRIVGQGNVSLARGEVLELLEPLLHLRGVGHLVDELQSFRFGDAHFIVKNLHRTGDHREFIRGVRGATAEHLQRLLQFRVAQAPKLRGNLARVVRELRHHTGRRTHPAHLLRDHQGKRVACVERAGEWHVVHPQATLLCPRGGRCDLVLSEEGCDGGRGGGIGSGARSRCMGLRGRVWINLGGS